MPSTYAHYRMGKEVMKLVGPEEKRLINKYPELYLIGLHGPDILFYYKALWADPINKIGYDTHGRSGREFFERAAVTIAQSVNREAAEAYIYGFICHFALDETCHGYIDEKIEASGVSHTEIEVEFDRELMVMDGKDPLRTSLTDHIVPSYHNAVIISPFFKGTTPKEVMKGLKGMISYNRLLIAPSHVKRKVIYGLLKATGNYEEMHGLLVNYEKNPLCDDSTKKLMELYGDATGLAVRLIGEYTRYLFGDGALDDVYNYTFGSKLLGE